MAHPRSRFRGSGPKRMTSWFEVPPVSTVLAGGGGTITHSLTALELAKRPFTIVRTHIEAYIESDQFSSGELQIGAIGGVVVSSQALNVGVSAVPTPLNELESDFFWFHQIMMSSVEVATNIGSNAPSGRGYSVDSKAMRKVSEDEDALIVVEGSTVGDGIVITLAGRILIKEH